MLATLLPLSLILPAAAACSREPNEVQARAATQANSQVQPQTQGPWRGLDVPRYTNGTDFQIEADEDEYEIYFRSGDDIRAVSDFYRNYLQQQGFRVALNKTKEHGFKANMVRGQGPNDTIELDAKLKDGRFKVEIEFDE